LTVVVVGPSLREVAESMVIEEGFRLVTRRRFADGDSENGTRNPLCRCCLNDIADEFAVGSMNS
jgi:hypothetical protein